MKIYCSIVLLFTGFIAFGQKSYYFSDPLPSEEAKIERVESQWHGIYTSGDGTLSYVVNENGILLETISISSISRESIRESARYDVHNGYIFGVVENDSVPCVLKDEFYYFGIKNRDVFIGAGSMSILSKTTGSGVYIINRYENGNYIPMLLEFKRGKLSVSRFDYDGEDANEFSYIASQEIVSTNDIDLIILSPTVMEFQELRNRGVFASTRVFKK